MISQEILIFLNGKKLIDATTKYQTL